MSQLFYYYRFYRRGKFTVWQSIKKAIHQSFGDDLFAAIGAFKREWSHRRWMRAGHCPDGDGGSTELPF